ncbi:unnamed protein product [Didymodactylos carnosus]|uniref:Uncharacterized protein n=1 Tax=Didymodactylos carnosus TaxID=1234261 RepID=A0A8S2NH57_9BILA|nr:unnamed protein product [Didymodactylos carnosus]CAF4000850.1 unnamed protein product [Didymodactylos carnosus]
MCRRNYSRADWTKFVRNIDDAIRAIGLEAALIRNKDEIDKFAKQIDDILLNAAHVTIPKWHKHLEQIRISAARELGKIKRWISQNKLQDVKTLIDLYKTRLISKIDYGASVWSATLAKSSLKIIEKIQKQYLSYAVDSFEISSQAMEAECRILPLRLHLKMKRLKKAASIKSKGLFNPLRKIIVKSKSCPLTIMNNEIESSMIVDEKLKMCMNNLELIPRFQPSPPSIISEIK